MSISVGAFFPDSALRESEFANALTQVAMALARKNDHPVQSATPEVEILFMLSGKYDYPGFSGMRIRRFDTKLASLVVEVAVPVTMVDSGKAGEYVVAAMLDATENAAEFLKELDLAFDAGAHMTLVQSLSKCIASQAKPEIPPYYSEAP
ncbi:hypothetical protein SAMN02745866_01825 [Alteromonadaceae bacterium Bs31]|nr:hypothetical protein SAMN02745866_01825 [Alteromonadaceae bacterium Bs31]